MKRLRALIPKAVKRRIQNYYVQRKYDVKICQGAFVNRFTWFEGGNVVYNDTEIRNSEIGFGTYIAKNSEISMAKVGRFCSIGQNVTTYLGMHPTTEFVSTHPAFFSTACQAGFSFVKQQLFTEHKYVDAESRFVVDIGNDVWIGNGVMIMDGVTIGDGAIIAGGSVITKDVPPYAIYGGVPGKPIRQRFEDREIAFLLDFKWWEKDNKWLARYCSEFACIDDFRKTFEVQEVKHIVPAVDTDGCLHTGSES